MPAVEMRVQQPMVGRLIKGADIEAVDGAAAEEGEDI